MHQQCSSLNVESWHTAQNAPCTIYMAYKTFCGLTQKQKLFIHIQTGGSQKSCCSFQLFSVQILGHIRHHQLINILVGKCDIENRSGFPGVRCMRVIVELKWDSFHHHSHCHDADNHHDHCHDADNIIMIIVVMLIIIMVIVTVENIIMDRSIENLMGREHPRSCCVRVK